MVLLLAANLFIIVWLINLSKIKSYYVGFTDEEWSLLHSFGFICCTYLMEISEQ
jgi:hypothetical protein